MPNTLTDPCAPEWGEPARWQLPLAQLCDSALPTGAFSHSFGLETYICDGIVDGEKVTCEPAHVLAMAQRYFLF